MKPTTAEECIATAIEKVGRNLLLYWMEERQRIYLKRQAGENPPWTEDKILQSYFFCNVYREQDKVTVWIRENWREPFADHKNLWFAMCVARQINLPSTLETIGFPKQWRPSDVLKKLEALKASGKKVYSGAYMLTGMSRKFKGVKERIPKTRITVEEILDGVYQYAKQFPPPWETETACPLSKAWEWLRKQYGFGPFLAYEVVTDLRHTRYLQDAWDIKAWANAGPGAKRGLNRLHDRPLHAGLNNKQALKEMGELADWIRENRDKALLPTLEMRDVEHSLCEFDKYRRIQDWQTGKHNRMTIGLRRFGQPVV